MRATRPHVCLSDVAILRLIRRHTYEIDMFSEFVTAVPPTEYASFTVQSPIAVATPDLHIYDSQPVCLCDLPSRLQTVMEEPVHNGR